MTDSKGFRRLSRAGIVDSPDRNTFLIRRPMMDTAYANQKQDRSSHATRCQSVHLEKIETETCTVCFQVSLSVAACQPVAMPHTGRPVQFVNGLMF